MGATTCPQMGDETPDTSRHRHRHRGNTVRALLPGRRHRSPYITLWGVGLTAPARQLHAHCGPRLPPGRHLDPPMATYAHDATHPEVRHHRRRPHAQRHAGADSRTVPSRHGCELLCLLAQQRLSFQRSGTKGRLSYSPSGGSLASSCGSARCHGGLNSSSAPRDQNPVAHTLGDR